MRSIAEALASMLPAFTPLGEEELHLTEASGRYLSREVTARFDSPPFDNSAMDGYAVHAADVQGAAQDGPVELLLRGESRAGGPLPSPLEPGAACRIFTGAPMPVGADAVVMQEDTEQRGDRVRITEASPRAKHVRAQGSDVSSGATLVRPGDRLWPGELGLLASQNIDRVHVYRRPTVALLSTGDELRALGEELEPGAIVNSNVYVLTEMLRSLGVIPVALPAARDNLPEIEAALRKALQADVVITMGGVSVIGVPGNPISAMITFEVLVAPCLRKMLGDPRPHPQPVMARLRNSYRRRPGRVEIARAVASREGDELVVALHDRQGSGSLPSFVGINALVILPADKAELSRGEQVEAILWGPGLRSDRSAFDGMD